MSIAKPDFTVGPMAIEKIARDTGLCAALKIGDGRARVVDTLVQVSKTINRSTWAKHSSKSCPPQ